MFDANIITNVTWGASIDPCLDYFPMSTVNTHANRCHVRDNLLCHRNKERLCSHYNMRNTLVNLWGHRRDEGRDGLVT